MKIKIKNDLKRIKSLEKGYVFFTLLLTGFLCACSAESTSVMGDKSLAVSNSVEETQEHTGSVALEAIKTGFYLTVPGVSEDVMLTPDEDLSEVLPLLGNAYSYFEAPSCAFRGTDKIYTFSDFQIDTYPDGDTDRIYLISLLSDMVMTNEGLMIGSPEGLIVSTYGEPQEKRGDEYLYVKDSVKLGLVAQNGIVTAITYYSTVE